MSPSKGNKTKVNKWDYINQKSLYQKGNHQQNKKMPQ